MRPSIYRGLNKDAMGRAPQRPQATRNVHVRNVYADGTTYTLVNDKVVKKTPNDERPHWHVRMIKIDRSIRF